MEICLPVELNMLADLFAKGGHRLFAVGGAVRNRLLGLPPSDCDVCGDALPEELSAFLGGGVRIIYKSRQLGTVELHMDGLVCEYTAFREESYPPGGAHRPGNVKFGATLEQDAFRRDFTINAIYADCTTGRILDPAGGLDDLEKRIVRVTGGDPGHILGSDGLRVLRLARFASELGFSIDPASFTAAGDHSGGLADISVERIWAETVRLILADTRYRAPRVDGMAAHHRAFVLLDELGALRYVFPELLEGKGVEQRGDYHAYNVFEHAMHSLAASAPVLPVRLAALLHDVAKPVQIRKTGKMLYHDSMGAHMARNMLERLRAPNALVDRVELLIANHMFDLDGKARPSTVRKYFVRLGLAAAQQLILVREADYLGSGMQQAPVETAVRFKAILSQMQAQNVPFSENQLNVSGEDLMRYLNLSPGKQIGELKRQLFTYCIYHPQANKREQLLRLARQFLKQMK